MIFSTMTYQESAMQDRLQNQSDTIDGLMHDLNVAKDELAQAKKQIETLSAVNDNLLTALAKERSRADGLAQNFKNVLDFGVRTLSDYAPALLQPPAPPESPKGITPAHEAPIPAEEFVGAEWSE